MYDYIVLSSPTLPPGVRLADIFREHPALAKVSKPGAGLTRGRAAVVDVLAAALPAPATATWFRKIDVHERYVQCEPQHVCSTFGSDSGPNPSYLSRLGQHSAARLVPPYRCCMAPRAAPPPPSSGGRLPPATVSTVAPATALTAPATMTLTCRCCLTLTTRRWSRSTWRHYTRRAGVVRGACWGRRVAWGRKESRPQYLVDRALAAQPPAPVPCPPIPSCQPHPWGLLRHHGHDLHLMHHVY